MQMKQMKYSQPIQKVQYGGVVGQVPRPSTEGKFASNEPYLKMSGMGQPLSPKMHPPFVTSTMVPEGAETRPSTHLQVPMRQLKTQYSQSQLHHTHLPETRYLGPRSSHSQLHRAPESRIEYVPYESYYIDYEERPMITSVRVPVQRKYTDYYTVQHITEYVPREVEEKHIEMVEEEIVRKKVFYTPVQTHIVHFPEDKLQNTNYKSKHERKINVCQVSIPNRSGEDLDQPEIYEK